MSKPHLCPHCGKPTALKYAFPEEYRRRKSENIRNSIAKARANGTKLGRPISGNPGEIIEFRRLGFSYREIARGLKCSIGLVAKTCKGAGLTVGRGKYDRSKRPEISYDQTDGHRPWLAIGRGRG